MKKKMCQFISLPEIITLVSEARKTWPRGDLYNLKLRSKTDNGIFFFKKYLERLYIL